MSTFNCAIQNIPAHLNQKALKEKKRREEINQKMAELRGLMFEDQGDKIISQAKVLGRAVEILRGDTVSTSSTASSPGASSSSSSSSSSSPDLSSKSSTIGPIRSRKEVRKNREQGRRDLQGSGYEALREYITTNNLAEPERLDRNTILDIVISEIRKIKSLLPSPSVSPIIPPPTVVNPPLPFPIIPYLQLVYFNYLMWLQSLAQFKVQAQIEVPKTEEEDDNDCIDVVN